MRNAIDLTSITFRWTSSSSRESVFSTTLDGSQRSPTTMIRIYLIFQIWLGDNCLQTLGNFLAAVPMTPEITSKPRFLLTSRTSGIAGVPSDNEIW